MKLTRRLEELRRMIDRRRFPPLLWCREGEWMMDGRTLTYDEALEIMKEPGSVAIHVVREDRPEDGQSSEY